MLEEERDRTRELDEEFGADSDEDYAALDALTDEEAERLLEAAIVRVGRGA